MPVGLFNRLFGLVLWPQMLHDIFVGIVDVVDVAPCMDQFDRTTAWLVEICLKIIGISLRCWIQLNMLLSIHLFVISNLIMIMLLIPQISVSI